MINTHTIYKKCKCGIIHILDIPESMEDITVSRCGCMLVEMEVIEEYEGIIDDIIASMERYRSKYKGKKNI